MNIQKVLFFLFFSLYIASSSLWAQNVALSNDKANVFYIGINNPVSVAVAGIPNQNIVLEGNGSGVAILPTGEGKYDITISQQGETILTLKDSKSQKIYATFKYRCKKIPDPTVQVGIIQANTVPAAEMRAQMGLLAQIPNFDYDMKPNIESYTLYYNNGGETAISQSKNSRFTGDIAKAIANAEKGDTYTFTDIRVRCSGDATARRVNDIKITIQ
jgi:hypothetical protein